VSIVPTSSPCPSWCRGHLCDELTGAESAHAREIAVGRVTLTLEQGFEPGSEPFVTLPWESASASFVGDLALALEEANRVLGDAAELDALREVAGVAR